MDNMPKRAIRIAVFSVSAGSGHVRAAQALIASAGLWFPEVEVIHVDMMDLVPKLFRTIYTETYIKLIEQHPAVWSYLFNRTNTEKNNSYLSRIRRSIETISTRKLKCALKEIAPDHVICTHFLPAQLFSRRIEKGKYYKPVWVQITDFDAHTLWIHKWMNGYFVAHDELAWRISERGITFENVHVTGIPIMPSFSEILCRRECSEELGLNPSVMTILLMSGGDGIGDSHKLAERLLLAGEGDFQIIALAGKNEKLLKKFTLLAERHPGKLFPLGFIHTVERVMAASDFAITKPGGLTSSECLAMGLPMVVVSPIPGQEERNTDFLLEHGVAVKACDENALIWRVNMLLREPHRLKIMRDKALMIGRHDSARMVLDIVLGKLAGAHQ